MPRYSELGPRCSWNSMVPMYLHTTCTLLCTVYCPDLSCYGPSAFCGFLVVVLCYYCATDTAYRHLLTTTTSITLPHLQSGKPFFQSSLLAFQHPPLRHLHPSEQSHIHLSSRTLSLVIIGVGTYCHRPLLQRLPSVSQASKCRPTSHVPT